ncbi:hypothetical protein ABPG74_015400 [Tetrahymena malaccensis]
MANISLLVLLNIFSRYLLQIILDIKDFSMHGLQQSYRKEFKELPASKLYYAKQDMVQNASKIKSVFKFNILLTIVFKFNEQIFCLAKQYIFVAFILFLIISEQEIVNQSINSKFISNYLGALYLVSQIGRLQLLTSEKCQLSTDLNF